MQFAKYLCFIPLLFAVSTLKGQIDTTHDPERDTFYWIVENRLEKNKFLGNAWYIAAAYSRSKTNEVDFNLGRSYVKYSGGGGGTVITMNTWGLGYGTTWKDGQNKSLGKCFVEHSFFYFPPLAWTLRAEYLYNFNDREHYLRPSIGLNLFVLDILYHYSFKLNGSENDLKHGITIRFKIYTNSKKWESRRPNRC